MLEKFKEYMDLVFSFSVGNFSIGIDVTFKIELREVFRKPKHRKIEYIFDDEIPIYMYETELSIFRVEIS